MSNIHPSAVVEDGAQIAASAKIGPLCYVSGKAKIGENVQLIAHVTILGDTTIGEGTIVFPGAVLGAGPLPCMPERRKSTLRRRLATTACL